MERLEAIIGRAYTLAAQVLNGDTPDLNLAEEISGECAELLAHLDGDGGAFDSESVIDFDLVQLAQALKQLETTK